MNLKDSLKRRALAMQKHIKKENLSNIVLFGLRKNPNFFYFVLTDIIGVINITKSSLYFYVPEMELLRAEEYLKQNNIDFIKLKRLSSKVIDNIIKKNTGVDYSSLSHAEFIKLGKPDLSNISNEIQRLRIIKDDYEIGLLKKAASLSKEVLNKVIDNILKFKTENEISAYIKYEIAKLGLKPSFEPIVANAENSAKPHHVSTKRKLKRGFLLIDFGLIYKGYISDITRTYYLGKPLFYEIKAYENLLKIQEDTIKLIKPGVSIKELNKFVTPLKHMNHSLGHGIGIEVHEYPAINQNNDTKIMRGMAFTVEPGVYYKGKFGIRIEDDIIVKDKALVLSKINKHLRVFLGK